MARYVQRGVRSIYKPRSFEELSRLPMMYTQVHAARQLEADAMQWGAYATNWHKEYAAEEKTKLDENVKSYSEKLMQSGITGETALKDFENVKKQYERSLTVQGGVQAHYNHYVGFAQEVEKKGTANKDGEYWKQAHLNKYVQENKNNKVFDESGNLVNPVNVSYKEYVDLEALGREYVKGLGQDETGMPLGPSYFRDEDGNLVMRTGTQQTLSQERQLAGAWAAFIGSDEVRNQIAHERYLGIISDEQAKTSAILNPYNKETNPDGVQLYVDGKLNPKAYEAQYFNSLMPYTSTKNFINYNYNVTKPGDGNAMTLFGPNAVIVKPFQSYDEAYSLSNVVEDGKTYKSELDATQADRRNYLKELGSALFNKDEIETVALTREYNKAFNVPEKERVQSLKNFKKKYGLSDEQMTQWTQGMSVLNDLDNQITGLHMKVDLNKKQQAELGERSTKILEKIGNDTDFNNIVNEVTLAAFIDDRALKYDDFELRGYATQATRVQDVKRNNLETQREQVKKDISTLIVTGNPQVTSQNILKYVNSKRQKAGFKPLSSDTDPNLVGQFFGADTFASSLADMGLDAANAYEDVGIDNSYQAMSYTFEFNNSTEQGKRFNDEIAQRTQLDWNTLLNSMDYTTGKTVQEVLKDTGIEPNFNSKPPTGLITLLAPEVGMSEHKVMYNIAGVTVSIDNPNISIGVVNNWKGALAKGYAAKHAMGYPIPEDASIILQDYARSQNLYQRGSIVDITNPEETPANENGVASLEFSIVPDRSTGNTSVRNMIIERSPSEETGMVYNIFYKASDGQKIFVGSHITQNWKDISQVHAMMSLYALKPI